MIKFLENWQKPDTLYRLYCFVDGQIFNWPTKHVIIMNDLWCLCYGLQAFAKFNTASNNRGGVHDKYIWDFEISLSFHGVLQLI